MPPPVRLCSILMRALQKLTDRLLIKNVARSPMMQAGFRDVPDGLQKHIGRLSVPFLEK